MANEKYKKIDTRAKNYHRMTILWNYLVLEPRDNERNEWFEDYFPLYFYAVSKCSPYHLY